MLWRAKFLPTLSELRLSMGRYGARAKHNADLRCLAKFRSATSSYFSAQSNGFKANRKTVQGKRNGPSSGDARIGVESCVTSIGFNLRHSGYFAKSYFASASLSTTGARGLEECSSNE
ncbi:hypothetical protein KM043_012475 [Ampulex compressa]|nr:hypothetical protein KM043_012475 [Ampulex compressa]